MGSSLIITFSICVTGNPMIKKTRWKRFMFPLRILHEISPDLSGISGPFNFRCNRRLNDGVYKLKLTGATMLFDTSACRVAPVLIITSPRPCKISIKSYEAIPSCRAGKIETPIKRQISALFTADVQVFRSMAPKSDKHGLLPKSGKRKPRGFRVCVL